MPHILVVFESRRDYERAVDYHNQALDINRETGNTPDLVIDLQNLAKCHLALNNFSSSIEYAEEVIWINNNVTEFFEQKLEFCLDFASQLIEADRYTAAKKYLDIFGKDIHQRMQKERRITSLELSWLIWSMRLRARCYRRDGIFREAEQAYDSAMDISEKEGMVEEFFSIGIERIYFLIEMGENEEALSQTEELRSRLELVKDQIELEYYQKVAKMLQELI